MKRFLLALLVLILIGGAGFGGWKYWQTQKTNTTQKDPTEGGKYLVIKEWGVRFRLPEDLRGTISYKAVSADYPSFQLISNGVDLDSCAPLSISRLQKGGVSHKKIGDSYYEFINGAHACDLESSVRQISAAAVQESLFRALNSLDVY